MIPQTENTLSTKNESGLNTFIFEGDKPIRTTEVDGKLYFVAKDIAEALGYVWKGASGTIPHVPEEWRGVRSVQTPSGTQEITCLTEEGLYFFVNRSDKPKAIPFQKWIAGEVLPSIRKTGGYSTHNFDPSKLTRKDILVMALESEERALAAEAKVEELTPLADTTRKFLDTEGLFSLRKSAKELGMQQNEFIEWLAYELRWIYKPGGVGAWEGRSEVCNKNFVDHKIRVFNDTPKAQVYITPKGLHVLRLKNAERQSQLNYGTTNTKAPLTRG